MNTTVVPVPKGFVRLSIVGGGEIVVGIPHILQIHSKTTDDLKKHVVVTLITSTTYECSYTLDELLRLLTDQQAAGGTAGAPQPA